MTLSNAVDWLNGHVGNALDFDGRYGCQCVDLFNYYYQFLTGHSPYQDGYAVPSAAALYSVATPSGFIKVANDPHNPNQNPPQGAILIYPGSMSGTGGNGHVEIVDHADANGVTVWVQNWGGVQKVQHLQHGWPCAPLGWLIPNFSAPQPPAPVQPTYTLAKVVIPVLNVRSQPSTSAPIVGQVNAGDVVNYVSIVAGSTYTINGQTSNLWCLSQQGHYYAKLGCA